MTRILPFHGVLYDTEVVGDIKHLVAPPYDIIDATGQQALHDRHPQNIIRLELGLDQPSDSPTQNRYTRAAVILRDWLKSGALKRDTHPSIYYHTIEYLPPHATFGSPKKLLRSFLAVTKLEVLDSGDIYPHENTRAAAKTDRLNLLEACGANFSPIWSLYSDPQGLILELLEAKVKGTPARYDFHDDAGCRQCLWPVTDRALLKQIVDTMQNKPLFIADGHHRYETALNYQKLCRQQTETPLASLQPYDSVLMLLAPLEDPGLTILPTHRVTTTPLPPEGQIRAMLGEIFEFQEFSFTESTRGRVREEFLSALRMKGRTAHVFGVALKGCDRYLILTLKPALCPSIHASPRTKLDVSLLQQLIIAKVCPSQQEQEAIRYTKDDHEALDWTAEGTGTGALLLNATKVGEIQAVATAGERMPHKSTYFFPKPLTGLVINVLANH